MCSRTAVARKAHMKASGFNALIARFDAVEYGICRQLNRGAALPVPQRVFVRERPFITHSSIALAGAPLDRYSFPSGHTLHAVSFAWQASAHFPELGLLLLPLAALIAGSRVVLGLHYPTDVLVGAAIGASLAELGLSLG